MEASEQAATQPDEPMRIGIVGGGPAGLVAALALACRGIRTTVFERDAHPDLAPRYNPDHPMKLTLYVALLWAVWHLPDHFAEEGWGVEALISAPIIFVVEFVSLFFARALFVWFYNVTAFSVLLVAIFHASFDAAINQLSHDVVPASNTTRFLIFSATIVLAATTVIIATKGRLGRAREAVETQTVVSDQDI
jgi:hypothetical protein